MRIDMNKRLTHILAEVHASMSALKQTAMGRGGDGGDRLQGACKNAVASDDGVPRSPEGVRSLEVTTALPVVDGNQHAPASLLVVISEANERHAVCRILDEAGLETIFVSTVHEARGVLLHKPVRLVICAAQLADGTFRDLLSLTPGVRAGMVILCSGRCSPGLRIDILEMGILDYVSHPIRPEELIWVVRGALVKNLSDEARPAVA